MSSVKPREFNNLKKQLHRARRIVISTHTLPDGDGLGAEAALVNYLKPLKKLCRVYNPDPVPPRYRFLDRRQEFLSGSKHPKIWDSFDLWIIVDTNDPRRLGPLWAELSVRAKHIVFLDHHPETMAEKKRMALPPHASIVSDIASSSIGELLHHLFEEIQIAPISPEVAIGLYVSVMTDTNSFRYARTTPPAHRIAASCIELGVNPEEVYQAIYSSKEVSHLQLLGEMLQNVQVSAGGRIAWLEIGLSLRKKHAASADDTQSFLNLLLLLKNAEVVCLFREEDDHRVRVSIKSKGRIAINQIAMEFGGGGHEFAAGLALTASLEKTVTAVIGRLETLLKSSKSG